MRIAFYAPLKPPDHPVPSGDRRMARLFLAALRAAGHRPALASRLRSYDDGDPARQARLAARAERVAQRLITGWRQRPDRAPRLWFTYHLYHKAPDWLGPPVADALGIPYVIAEASFAAKQAAGRWAPGHAAAARAIARADAVIGLNEADREGVLPLLAAPSRWVAMRPFLDAAAYAPSPGRPEPHSPRLIAVAMTRPGDKLASYRVLGAALARLLDLPWSLDVVGDGPAREAVAAALAPLASRVIFQGELGTAATAARLAAADLCVWPAINEAYGMALLEAQASGLPVVAGRTGGVPGIIADGSTGLLVPPGDAAAFAAAVRQLLLDPAQRLTFAAAARRKMLAEHDLPQAAARLAALIDALGHTGDPRRPAFGSIAVAAISEPA